MRGVDESREPTWPGLGPPRFGAVPVACSWGCVLGPDGWSSAPFCPVHRPTSAAEAERSPWQVAICPVNRSAMGEASGAWDVLRPDLDFCSPPSGLEEFSEDENEEEDEDVDEKGHWAGFREPWVSQGDELLYAYRDPISPYLDQEPPLAPPHLPSLLQAKMGRLPAPWGHRLTAEEAERNARELVAEEERAKRKAEKKKLKKKKQKDRKKREKLGQEQKTKQEAEPSTPAVGTEHSQSSTTEEGEGLVDPSPSPGPKGSSGKEGGGQGARAEELEDELDLSCTFVSKARQKAGVRLPVPGKEKPARTRSAEPGKRVPEKVPKAEPLDMSAVEQSLILAGHGNEVAQQGRYGKAVQAFTKAVKLNPQEHRLFGNRSYCYEKLGRYEEALQDAQESLRLQPGWPKGFFRKGKALRGLQRYAEAICTFEELLRRNGANTEAAAQLQACRALLHQSSCRSTQGGVPLSRSPLAATKPPLSPSGARACKNWQDTDTSGFITIVNSRSQASGQVRSAASSPLTLPPTHPARDCYPLWVGNVTSLISEKVLQGAFGRFGEIRSMRLLPGRRCAFINYRRKKAAEAAYAAMQDAELEGSRLLLQLKHPSHATPSPLQHPEVGAPTGGLL